MAKIKQAMDSIHAKDQMGRMLAEVTSHVQRVESVGFYIGDKVYTMLERSESLVATKSNLGILTQLHDRPYQAWSDDECLLVCALKALFISGRSVRFEEFNGMTLTATSLFEKFEELARLYGSVGCEVGDVQSEDIFTIAQQIRDATLKAVGASWLRYRWIYGLSFYKTERIIKRPSSTENQDGFRKEFEEFYEVAVETPPSKSLSEADYFRNIAKSVVERDLAAAACPLATAAASTWVEVFIEKIVASAVRVTQSDYGMSSSLRRMGRLIQPTDQALIDELHKLKPADFYTCFVTDGMDDQFDHDLVVAAAQSVQRRMMFNRWHFIPGNFDEALISEKRHWYFPPLIPDIAIHSDVHREAHAKAMVKYSIRAPGPDMSQPKLMIGTQGYRGFYDVRVVRVDGVTFGIEEMLRTRRRTLWMGILFDEIVPHLVHAMAADRLEIKGFEAGKYIDIASKRRGPDRSVRIEDASNKVTAS